MPGSEYHRSFTMTEGLQAVRKGLQMIAEKYIKDLEKAKIINKKVYPVVPPKTEYSLTDLGKTLFPVIKVMDDWGANYRNS